MLIITLRKDETLTIGNDEHGIKVAVTKMTNAEGEIIGGQVKLGITAPRHIRVTRGKSLTGRPATRAGRPHVDTGGSREAR